VFSRKKKGKIDAKTREERKISKKPRTGVIPKLTRD
jgi:hypothetical protein